jgi:hypothetical protein
MSALVSVCVSASVSFCVNALVSIMVLSWYFVMILFSSCYGPIMVLCNDLIQFLLWSCLGTL